MRPQPELALGLLRLIVGLLFAWHGFEKIFRVGLQDVSAEFGRMGVPLPLLTAPLSATLELVGGLLLALGVGTRGLALLLAAVTGALLLIGAQRRLPTPVQFEATGLLVLSACAVGLGGIGWPALGRRTGMEEHNASPSPSRTRKRTR